MSPHDRSNFSSSSHLVVTSRPPFEELEALTLAALTPRNARLAQAILENAATRQVPAAKRFKSASSVVRQAHSDVQTQTPFSRYVTPWSVRYKVKESSSGRELAAGNRDGKFAFRPPPRPIAPDLTEARELLKAGLPTETVALAQKADVIPTPTSLGVEAEDKRHLKRRKASETSIAPIAKDRFTIKRFSKEQRAVYDMALAGDSLFFTGSAGTGKSRLLLSIIKGLRREHRKRRDVAVTAMTGLAACSIGGQTLHSWAGIGLGKDDTATLLQKVQESPQAVRRWREARTLVLDEVSMLDPALFDKLDAIGRELREEDAPWGGLQLVFSGDFYQLPPIPAPGQETKYAFEAEGWRDAMPRQIRLHKVFRQSDTELIRNLNLLRFGELTPEATDYFKALDREPVYDDGVMPTQLFPLRDQVSQANAECLAALPGEIHTFMAQDTQLKKGYELSASQLDDRLLTPSKLDLKIGAQVLLVKNLVQGELVNGTAGKVVGFVDKADFGEELADQPFDQLPVIEWTMPNGTKSEALPVTASRFEVMVDGEVAYTRRQLPCILAWALSIHKSQGQTIERLKIDVGQVFEKGQVYVAISRGTSVDGLQVLNFDPEKVSVDARVKEFDGSLEVLGESQR